MLETFDSWDISAYSNYRNSWISSSESSPTEFSIKYNNCSWINQITKYNIWILLLKVNQNRQRKLRPARYRSAQNQNLAFPSWRHRNSRILVASLSIYSHILVTAIELGSLTLNFLKRRRLSLRELVKMADVIIKIQPNGERVLYKSVGKSQPKTPLSIYYLYAVVAKTTTPLSIFLQTRSNLPCPFNTCILQ